MVANESLGIRIHYVLSHRSVSALLPTPSIFRDSGTIQQYPTFTREPPAQRKSKVNIVAQTTIEKHCFL